MVVKEKFFFCTYIFTIKSTTYPQLIFNVGNIEQWLDASPHLPPWPRPQFHVFPQTPLDNQKSQSTREKKQKKC